ncbi:MAG: EamA family transporter [Chthoniobacterales bacterium]|nr:EamA family transporter [Chthoniobacterales bacterium]
MKTPERFAIFAAFAALYLIWGSTYLGILFAIDSIPPLLMAGSRFCTAGVLLYTIARLQGAPRSGWADWRTAAIVGACLLLGGNGGVTLAEQYVSSGLAAVIVATVPIYIALLGWLTGSAARPRPLVWLGLAGGLCGVAILVGSSLGLPAADHPRASIGMIILLVSSFLWSAGSLYSRRAKNAASPFLAAGQQMLCGGTLLLLAGIASGELRRFDPHRITAVSFVAWIYLVTIGAIVAFSAYVWLLRHCAPAKVATYAYVNPVVAVLLGAAFAGEKLTAWSFVAAALVVGSVAIVITADQRRVKAPVALR